MNDIEERVAECDWTDDNRLLVGCLVLLFWLASALAIESICRYSEVRSARLRDSQTLTPEALDVGVTLFGSRLYGLTHLPDQAQIALVGWFGLTIWFSDLSTIQFFNLIVRLGATHSGLIWLRCISIASTVTGLACPNYDVKGGKAGGFNGRRHDLMFSGHTATGTLLCAFTAHILRNGDPFWYYVTWFGAIANSALQVAVGDHYTSDVLVANYVTIPIALLMLNCR